LNQNDFVDINELSGRIIGAATYQSCLVHELRNLGLICEEQVAQPLVYKDIRLEIGYRIDLLVEKIIIVELKSVEKLTDVHIAQTLTYLKLSETPLALLINFNVPRLIDGLKRFIQRKE
jgi:GxxExxY protein